MSWNQWPAAPTQQPPVVAATPLLGAAPSVIPPGMPYTSDQWSQMQQQNWQQWAQWQQQYQQWHQQYGAEYQKSISALAAQQTVVPTMGVPPPLPLEPHPQPPLPKEEGPKPAPPLPVPVPPPQQPTIPSYTTQPPMHNQFSAPPPNFVATGAQQPWKGAANIDQKRPLQGSDDSISKRQMTNRQGWQNAAPPTANPNEELSEAEKKFDKQFKEWEAQFNKWKEQNSGHPDKQQYKEYEKKWEQWRQQLLDRREAMRRKRLGLPPAKSAPAQQQFNVPPPSQAQGAQPPLPASTQPQAPSGGPTQKDGQMMFSKPPPDMNNEPLQFKGNDKEPEPQEEGLGFLSVSKSDGIPGLDLVKDGDVDDIADDEPVQKGPDLEAISKGINNILGDQKLMSMLSMVSQGSSSNNLPKMADVSLSREQSNLSGEDSRNDHPEPIQNFDDQTRSSFTMQPNEPEYFRGNNNTQFGRVGGPPPTNFYENEPPYSRPPPNFSMPSQDDLKRPPPNRFGNDQPSFPQRKAGGLDRAPPTNPERRGALLPDPDIQPGFGQGNSFGPGNMNKGRDSFGPGRNRGDFGPRGDFERGPDANWNGPGNMGREKMAPGSKTDFGEEKNGSFGERPPFGKNFQGRNSFGNNYDDQDYGDEREPFNDERDFEGDGRPPHGQRFGPGSREERENFNGPPPNFRGGKDGFNERPLPNIRGGNERHPPNFRGGRDDFNEPPPPNFRGGNADFNERPPPNFRGSRDDINEPTPPNFRGGRDDYNERPPPNFRGGREDFNEPPQANFRGGRNERPPPNFKGGRDDFNEPPPPNFRGGRDDFNEPPPPNFRGGRDDFNKPPPPNFNNSRNDFRQDDMSFQRDGDYGNAPDDRFDRYPDERGPPNRGREFGRFNRSGDRFGGEFRDDYRPEGYEDDGDYPPPPVIEGFGRRDSMGPVDDAPEPPQFSRGPMDESGFEDMPPSDYVEAKPVEDIWKPVTVVDYEHKRVKPPEIDILVQPFRMFDYRHKFLRRIPYPDRPNWLSDAVKMIPEFDPPIIRPPPIDRRTFDDRFEPPRRDDRQIDRYRPEDRHPFDRKPYDVRFSPPPPKYGENDWSSRRRRSRSPPTHRFERPPLEGDRLAKDRDNWDQGKLGDRDRRGGNKRWEEEERFRGDRNYDRDRRDRRDDRGRDEDNWKRRGTEWEDRERKIRNPDMNLDKVDRDRNDQQFKTDIRNNERDTFNKKDGGSVFPFSKPIDGNKVNNVTPIEDLLNAPGRSSRPQRIVIILRGPPGSGKTYLAKMIKDKEVENGGSAPRILSLDDYFMVEQEKEIMEEGKRVKLKEMVYEFEAEMEESYRNSLIRSFKKTITDGYFPFIIVDNVNDKVKYFGEMWSFAKQNGFQVYVCQLDLDIQNCTKRNVHNRSEEEIRRCIEGWETTPSHHPILDVTSLLQGEPISEVEMEEINSTGSDFDDKDDGNEDQLDRSKWDNFDCSINNLARLDGLSKPPRPSRTMEEYLQLDDEWEITRPTKPGQKRVRWADLEERKQQEKMRAIGFVVGQTDWDRMMDPTMGQSALTQTKYIEKVQRRRF